MRKAADNSKFLFVPLQSNALTYRYAALPHAADSTPAGLDASEGAGIHGKNNSHSRGTKHGGRSTYKVNEHEGKMNIPPFLFLCRLGRRIVDVNAYLSFAASPGSLGCCLAHMAGKGSTVSTWPVPSHSKVILPFLVSSSVVSNPSPQWRDASSVQTPNLS